MIAYVNGSPIEQAEFRWYAAVFIDTNNEISVARDTVLLSLINQELVAQEASRRSIAVPLERLDANVAQVESSETEGSLAREGGIDGLRYRVNAFLLMQLVRGVVVPPVTISEAEIAGGLPFRRSLLRRVT